MSLGDTIGTGTGFVGRPAALLEVSDGRFLLADRQDPGSLKLFTANGEFIERIGREGEGPGEYRIVNFLFRLPGDSIEVVDIALRRATILAPDLSQVRIKRLVGATSDMIRTEEGEYIAAMRSRDPKGAGFPLHRMLPDGRIASSFGADPPIPSSADRDQFVRKLAPGVGSSFWAGALTRYVLEEWTSGGELRRAMRRSVDWFPEQDEFGPGDPESPPHPGLRALHRDGAGMIWVAAAVPDENWRAAYEGVPDRLGLSEFQVDYNRAYDTIVERIDPDTKEVRAQVRLEGYVLGFAGDGLPYSLDTSRTGEPVIRVWNLIEN